ncbi:MAG TPA: PEGA domain-containing protein [Planctomycetota bacterium]|nr:PEGA domain-containing protein [Planctomycetota bacterium]
MSARRRPVAGWHGILTLAAALTAGCHNVRYVDIDSNPSGAKVWVDGVYVGLTPYKMVPLDFRSDAEKRVFIQIVRDGWKPTEVNYQLEVVPLDPVQFDLERD